MERLDSNSIPPDMQSAYEQRIASNWEHVVMNHEPRAFNCQQDEANIDDIQVREIEVPHHETTAPQQVCASPFASAIGAIGAKHPAASEEVIPDAFEFAAATQPTARDHDETLRQEVENAMLAHPHIKRFMESILLMEWCLNLYPKVYARKRR